LLSVTSQNKNKKEISCLLLISTQDFSHINFLSKIRAYTKWPIALLIYETQGKRGGSNTLPLMNVTKYLKILSYSF